MNRIEEILADLKGIQLEKRKLDRLKKNLAKRILRVSYMNRGSISARAQRTGMMEEYREVMEEVRNLQNQNT